MSTTATRTPDLPADLVDRIRHEVVFDLNNATDNVATYTQTDRLDEADAEMDRLETVAAHYRAIRHTEPDEWTTDVLTYGLEMILEDIRSRLIGDGQTIEEAAQFVDAARRVEALLVEVTA